MHCGSTSAPSMGGRGGREGGRDRERGGRGWGAHTCDVGLQHIGQQAEREGKGVAWRKPRMRGQATRQREREEEEREGVEGRTSDVELQQIGQQAEREGKGVNCRIPKVRRTRPERGGPIRQRGGGRDGDRVRNSDTAACEMSSFAMQRILQI